MKNILTLFIIVISSTAFAQAVKPCKCPDAGGSCSDAGVYGIDLYDSAYILRNWGNTDFKPNFETGVAATYVIKQRMSFADLDTVHNMGGTYASVASGGWNLWTNAADELNFSNFSPHSGSPVNLVLGGYDAGTHIVCISKSSGDLYKMVVDGIDLVSATSAQSASNQNWQTKFSDDPRPYKGVVYQTAFFYGVELSASQCGSIADGGLSIASFRYDAGMEFGYIFNRTGDDLAPVDPDYVQLFGKMKFSP